MRYTRHSFFGQEKMPRDIRRLYEFGLEDYEVRYLLSIARKREIGKRWKKYD